MGLTRKYWWALGLALFQGYFLSAAASNIIVNLVLIMVVYESLNEDILSSVKFALWAGFWLDLASNYHFGFRMLWFSGLAIVLSILKNKGQQTVSYTGGGLTVLMASLFYNFSLWLMLWVTGDSLVPVTSFFGIWIGEAIITSSISIFLLGRLGTNINSVKPRYEI